MSKKILIVDDDLDMLNLSKKILSNEGYSIKIVQDAGSIDAEKVLKDFNPDLLLLDIMMPAINGYDFCKKIKVTESGKDLKVIFLSGLKEKADKLRAFSAGAAGYMTKPFKKQDLIKNINYFFSLQEKPAKKPESRSTIHTANKKKKTFIEFISERFKVEPQALIDHLNKNG
ncbi:MAG: response regulator, partial [Elusimicrobiota bacterium]|nr:response regulator [Elusimicrobiota bacterium]